MEVHEFKITLLVTIEAPSEQDALDLIDDTFGLGEDCGVTIEDRKVAPLGPVKRR